MAIDIYGTLTGFLPSFSGSLILYSIIVLIVVAGLGFLAYFLFRNSKFNKKIVIFDRVGSIWQVVARDKAMEMNLAKSGDKVFFVKKAKKYLPRGNKQTGNNIYWYAIDASGKWHNIGLEDIDLVNDEVNFNMQIGMDYARTGIQKVTADRYSKVSWLRQHWADLLAVGTVIILLVFIWLIVREQSSLSQAAKGAVDAAAQVNQQTARILSALDTIKSGGSGIVPAT